MISPGPGLAKTLAMYDASNLTLSSIGSHSALDVASGAKAAGLRNLIITERGRERTYTEHYAVQSDPSRGCVDATIVLERFTDLLDANVQENLIEQNVIFVPNRSFEVYLHQKFSYDEIERGMRCLFFGNRRLLRAEERDEANNQYTLMQAAGIAFPKQFARSGGDRPARDGQGAARQDLVRARVLSRTFAGRIRREVAAPHRFRNRDARGRTRRGHRGIRARTDAST